MDIQRAPQLAPVLILLVCVTAGSTVLADDPPSLDDLAFLTGSWSGRSGAIDTEEIWIAPKGGVMLGLHRDAAPGTTAFYEYLRIEDRDGRLIYIASPRGGGTTEFTLVKVDEMGAVFENLEHDFPQRIIYRGEGDRLTARIEGVVDGELKASEWVWELAK